MSQTTWQETLVTAQADGPARATFTTAVTLLPDHAIYTIPANYFYIGRQLRVRAYGRISTFTSGTFTFDFRLGTLATPIIVFNGGALATVISLTNQTWELEMLMTCRAVGAGTAANLIGTGRFTSQVVTGGTAGQQAMSYPLPLTAPAVGTGFDSTIANVANLFIACSVSNAANAITLHQYSLEALN